MHAYNLQISVNSLEELKRVIEQIEPLHQSGPPDPPCIQYTPTEAQQPAVQAPSPITSPIPNNPVHYTFDDLSKASAVFAQGSPENRAAVLALRGEKFCVSDLTKLPPIQYGAFATELRQLGAAI